MWIVEWRRRKLKQYKPIHFIRIHSFIESFATSLSDASPYNLKEFFLIFEGSERSVGDRLSVIDARVDGRLYQCGDAVTQFSACYWVSWRRDRTPRQCEGAIKKLNFVFDPHWRGSPRIPT
jgi:hypothetical protein